MTQYDIEMRREEERLISEISSMKKFSFKKLLKVMELNALLTYQKA